MRTPVFFGEFCAAGGAFTGAVAGGETGEVFGGRRAGALVDWSFAVVAGLGAAVFAGFCAHFFGAGWVWTPL
jgi:hypothetical protein